jgi:hypothetical protein
MSKLVKVVKDTRKTEFDKSEALQDYRIVCESREVSLLGRREKAKSIQDVSDSISEDSISIIGRRLGSFAFFQY